MGIYDFLLSLSSYNLVKRSMNNVAEEAEDRQINSRFHAIVNYKELYQQEKSRRIAVEQQLETAIVKVKNLIANNTTKSKIRYCAQCSANISSKKELPKDGAQLISDFKDFSEKMDSRIFSSIRQELTTPSIMSKIEEGDPARKRHISMIENFAVFGIKQSQIEERLFETKSVKELEGEILFSKREANQTEQQASKLVFPSGMAVKKCSGVKAKDKTIELMSYCYTNLKSFLLNFECPDSFFDEHFHKNQLLDHLNPDRRLFCICIGIHDYTHIQNKKEKMNVSLGQIEGTNLSIPSVEEVKIRSQGHQQPYALNKESIKSIQDNIQENLQIGITQRVFCIMTYFPFFTFFQEILRNLINIVKTERLTIYDENEEKIRKTIKQTDSKYQFERMTTLLDDCLRDLEYKKLKFNTEYELRLLNQTKILMQTSYDEARTFFAREWVYSILSMFTFETFLDLFTLIMLEDRVVFICQNSHILTYVIYLFTQVLSKPLKYPFPVVNIIPGLDEDYLNAPFPVVYGLLKKRKPLEDRKILDQYDNTYVFLSPEKAELICQEDRRQILMNRSTKLLNNKELRDLFKDLKKSRKKQSKSTKYEVQTTDYCILANSQEKEKGLKIISIIIQFINQEVVKDLPNRFELQNKKNKMDPKILKEQKDEHGYLMNEIINDFKKKTKDPFVLQLLNTQIINNYLFA